MVAPDDVKDTEGVQLREHCTDADEKAVKGQIKEQENEEVFDDDDDDKESLITGVEIPSPDENSDNCAEYCPETRKNGKGDEIKENANVGIESGIDEPGNDKTGLCGNRNSGNRNTGAKSDKAVKGTPLYVRVLIFLVLFVRGGNCCPAFNSSVCNGGGGSGGGVLLKSVTLKYGENFSLICPIRKDRLKFCANGRLVYNGYNLTNLVPGSNSWLQMKFVENGCNISITAGVDTPGCFECLEAGSTKKSYFLIHSEPKDVENISTGFTTGNPGVENGSRGFSIITLMVVLVAVHAVPIFL